MVTPMDEWRTYYYERPVDVWRGYAEASLCGGSTPKQAAKEADEMMELEKKRFPAKKAKYDNG